MHHLPEKKKLKKTDNMSTVPYKIKKSLMGRSP
jgi:hypothetical protein